MVPKNGYGEVVNEILNLLSGFVLSAMACFTYYSAIGCIVAGFATWLYWNHAVHLAVKLDWNIISLAVILPTSQGISMAYKRREQALRAFATMSGNLREVFGALHYWKIPQPDKTWKSALYASRDEAQVDEVCSLSLGPTGPDAHARGPKSRL